MNKQEFQSLSEDYMAELNLRAQEKIKENAVAIDSFKSFSEERGVVLSDDDFSYHDTIGVVATKKNLTSALTGLRVDKEGLLLFEDLENQFEIKPHIAGYLYTQNFMAMAHPFFRRGFSGINNFAPRLIDLLWSLNEPRVEFSLALDPDRLRIDVSDMVYMEFDTWYGAPFSNRIEEIPDSLGKIRPPNLKKEYVSFFFNGAYCLDTVWKTKNGIKSFQAEEFKDENVKITVDSVTYYPARYIHAEYDPRLRAFRHFDGAIHLYSEEEYFSRRDSDCNHTQKGDGHIKPRSIKLFKMNGWLSVDSWVTYCSHFCSGNPLILEYFTGKYPDRLQETITKLQTKMT